MHNINTDKEMNQDMHNRSSFINSLSSSLITGDIEHIVPDIKPIEPTKHPWANLLDSTLYIKADVEVEVSE